MPIRRMNREEFFGRLATLDEQRLKKALWNLYWRGSAAMRERIEAGIDPDQHGHSRHPSKEPADPEQLLAEVRDFVALARSGAYMAGDRHVSPRERSRWRLTFKRLVGDAQDGLRAQDAAAAATALGRVRPGPCRPGRPIASHRRELIDWYDDHMSTQMTATEVKAKILSLLDAVAAGEEIEITKHGRTVARLVPAKGPNTLKGKLTGVAMSSADDEELFSTGATWDLP